MSLLQNCIRINATATLTAELPHACALPKGNIQALKNQLLLYRERNLEKVRDSDYNALGLSSEAHAIANAIGKCIVDAPGLQTQLVSLLRLRSAQQIAERSASLEALSVNAARLQEIRGETLRFSPEKVGHKLKKIGLLTRRLSQAGNGLVLDPSTRVLLHELSSTYSGEDITEGEDDLHCSLCKQSKEVI